MAFLFLCDFKTYLILCVDRVGTGRAGKCLGDWHLWIRSAGHNSRSSRMDHMALSKLPYFSVTPSHHL